MIRKIFLSILLASVFSLPASAQETIIHNYISNDNEGYSLGLLKIALSYYGKRYKLESTSENYSQGKQIEELKHGNLSVLWAGTSTELEDDLRPIRIPLFKGLLGSRVFIIRRDKQHLFNNIRTLEDLKRIRLGQGTTWADTAILKSADLNVVTTQKYPGLFYMLEGERFDAFPRGVHEPWSEIREHKELNLTVETGLMVVYRMPLYFFVSKENKKFARDLEQGLEKAIADGSFDDFFNSNRLVTDVLKNANMDQRRIFYIDNPFAHPKTPVDRKELWYN